MATSAFFAIAAASAKLACLFGASRMSQPLAYSTSVPCPTLLRMPSSGFTNFDASPV